MFSETRVTEGVAAAACEQSDGTHQINAAVTPLDQMTQQNPALVEESAAAAESLHDQSGRLSETIAVFKPSKTPVSAVRSALGTATSAKPNVKPSAKPVAAKPAAARPVAATKTAPKPAPKSAPLPAAVAATAGGDDGWATF